MINQMGPPGFEPGSKAPKAPSIAKLTHGPLFNAEYLFHKKLINDFPFIVPYSN